MTATHANCISDSVLVLEGALQPAGAAIVRQGEVAAVAVLHEGTGTRGDLLGAAREVLDRTGLTPATIGAVVTGTGPGSFTGLRVALGIARGLALARTGLPQGGLDSAQLLALAANVPLPAWVAIPWGRLRVLVARALVTGTDRSASVLVPRTELAQLDVLRGKLLVTTPALGPVALPHGTVRRVLTVSPIESLAALVARGAVPLDGTPGAAYIVPPDAVLPARRATLPPDFVLDPLRPDDLDEVVAVEQSSFASPWSENLLRDELVPDPTHVSLGVRAPDGQLAAIGLARLDVDALSIYTVAVRPGFRRHGVGRALVRALVARGRDGARPRVDLEVRVDNTAAIALYAGEGFVPVGRRPRYYHDGTDALLMSLTLSRT